MNAFARLLRWLALAWLLMASWSAHAVIDTNKSYNPINRNVGQTATLIISIFNSDPVNSATAASFTDTMPAGMSVSAVLSNSCGGTATATGTQLTLTGGTVPNASGSVSGACSVAAVVTALSPGTHVNTLVRTDVTANAPGPIIAEADALATMTVNPLARPTGTKAVAVDTDLHGGGTRAFVITLSNSNAIPLTNVGFTDTLPASLRIGTGGLVTNSCGGSVLDLGGGALDDGDTGLRLTGGTIAAGGSCSISFVFRPANDGAISNGGGGANTNSIPAGGVSTAEGVTNSAAISGTVNLRTGGAVGKGFSPSTITEGGFSTLTLTLTNRNLFTATAVDFTDAMPAGVTVQNLLSNSCGGSLNSFPSGTVTLTGGTIPAVTDPNSSGSASCAIVVRVTAPTAGDYANAIAAGSFGAIPLSYAATSATLRVIPPSPVSVSKAFAPGTVVHTGTSLLTITLNNAGGVPAAITSFTDNLLTMGNLAVRIAATPAPTTNCGGTLTATAGTTTISLTGGTIPASGNCQITVPVQAEPNGLGGNRTNTLPPDSLVTSVGNNENTATAALTINAALTAAKAFSPATITPSGTSRLTVTINHANGAPPFTNLSFIDNLPAGHTVAAPPDVFSTCGGTVTANAGSATFNLGGGFLPAGTSSCVVAVTIQAPAGTGAATNTIISGSVTTAEGVRSRAAASATLTRVSSGAPVTLNKSFLPTSINGGATSTLQITIANNNPGALALTGVALTDVMPTGMALAATPNPSFTGAGCTSATFVAVPLAGSVSFSGASIAANSVCNVTVVVTGLQDGNLTNNIPVSQLTSAQGVTNDNAPSATLTVLRNVGISKYFQPDTIVQGGTATLVIAVLNTNDVARTGTPTNTFTDNLPAGVTLASGVSTNSCAASSLTDGAGGALNAGDTSVRLNGGNFPAGSVCTLSVVVTSVTAGTVDNVIPPGSVTTLEGSTNPDPATARLRVLAPPTIAKSFNPTSLASAQPSTLTFTLSNPNSAALLPGGLTGAQFTRQPARRPDRHAQRPGRGQLCRRIGQSAHRGRDQPGDHRVDHSGGRLVHGGTAGQCRCRRGLSEPELRGHHHTAAHRERAVQHRHADRAGGAEPEQIHQSRHDSQWWHGNGRADDHPQQPQHHRGQPGVTRGDRCLSRQPRHHDGGQPADHQQYLWRDLAGQRRRRAGGSGCRHPAYRRQPCGLRYLCVQRGGAGPHARPVPQHHLGAGHRQRRFGARGDCLADRDAVGAPGSDQNQQRNHADRRPVHHLRHHRHQPGGRRPGPAPPWWTRRPAVWTARP
jgi:uncharacterized repeat protein (TIGR01451 family)